MFGSYSQPSESEFFRHSVHTYKVVQANWQQIELSFMQQPSLTGGAFSATMEECAVYDRSSVNSSSVSGAEAEGVFLPNPPSIPPKKNKVIQI